MAVLFNTFLGGKRLLNKEAVTYYHQFSFVCYALILLPKNNEKNIQIQLWWGNIFSLILLFQLFIFIAFSLSNASLSLHICPDVEYTFLKSFILGICPIMYVNLWAKVIKLYFTYSILLSSY